jgi:hypothetical protein
VADIWQDLKDAERGATAIERPNLRRLTALLCERPAVQAMMEVHGID